jgi:pimeloyl-ACP methyl ester carboxylesterase
MRARYPDNEGFAERDGVRLFFEAYEADAEEAILLVCPWAWSPARTWKAQIPFLARHFRVVAFDPRGTGGSDRPAEVEAHAAGEHAADAIAVMDAAGLERAAVVTVGPGVVQTLTLAALHPDRIDGMVLITPDPWPLKRYLDSAVKGELDAYEGWDKFNPAYWARDWSGFAAWWAAKLNAAPHSTKQIEDVIGYLLQIDAQTATAAAMALAFNTREGALSLAEQSVCPALVIYDDERQIVEADTWTPLARALDARLLRIPGANHGGPWRYPVPFNLAIREFVESIS